MKQKEKKERKDVRMSTGKKIVRLPTVNIKRYKKEAKEREKERDS